MVKITPNVEIGLMGKCKSIRKTENKLQEVDDKKFFVENVAFASQRLKLVSKGS